MSAVISRQQPHQYALVCQLTRKLMEDPVLALDGHTYERKAIEARFNETEKKGQALTSPKTGENLVSNILIPNRAIKRLTDRYRAEEAQDKIGKGGQIGGAVGGAVGAGCGGYFGAPATIKAYAIVSTVGKIGVCTIGGGLGAVTGIVLGAAIGGSVAKAIWGSHTSEQENLEFNLEELETPKLRAEDLLQIKAAAYDNVLPTVHSIPEHKPPFLPNSVRAA